MITVRLLTSNGDFLREVRVKSRPFEFIFQYGELFQRVAGTDDFKQVTYLEIC